MGVFSKPLESLNVKRGLSAAQLRELAKDEERTTEYGSASYITKVRNRSAKFTEIIYDEPTSEQQKTIEDVQRYLKDKSLICVDRSMCKNPGHLMHCRTYVTEAYSRIAYMWHQTLFDHQSDGKPDITVIDVPEWDERKVLVHPESGITYILGSDYFGEVKKANLRMAMWIAKKRGALGLHAGSKILRVQDVNGRLVEKGAILFGLSGTGKTTLTCHHHRLDVEKGEGVVIRQDDVVLMQPDMFCTGTENNYYIKTEGLEPEGQPVLYAAATTPRAILENIAVQENGNVDFLDYKLTSNGRCIVYRSDVRYTDDEIDLPHCDIVIFITRRNDIVPPVARLTAEQGAAFFMLGESIETSAGDPSQAGKSIRVVGTNPFIVGPEDEEGNTFRLFLRSNPETQCFLLNTGRVGERQGENISIWLSTEIIRQIARGGIEWEVDEDWGYMVPSKIDNIHDYSKWDPKRYYTPEKYKELTKKLKNERTEWLHKFSRLDQRIKDAIK